MSKKTFICPACGGHKLMAKYEAKYVYSYIIDADSPGVLNTEEFYPFLYDSREQTESKQYVVCNMCGAQYPCVFSTDNKGIESRVLQQAIGSEEPGHVMEQVLHNFLSE